LCAIDSEIEMIYNQLCISYNAVGSIQDFSIKIFVFSGTSTGFFLKSVTPPGEWSLSRPFGSGGKGWFFSGSFFG